ncbi:MAG TPA: permease-like cell division protein FtsX [Candidatus Bathyarchaeia archaeon]|nr:permease-like cell division protein FtsX [Candidatus Bathyarchaeia archaeon]
MRKILSTSWHYIRRSPYQALAAIAVMTLTLFISAVFVLLAAGSEKILSYFEEKPQVIAFFKDDVTKQEVDALTLRLLASGKAAAAKYVSKEQALEIYQDQNRDDPLLLEMVSAEILPASLEVSAKEIGFLGEIADILRSDSKVEEVNFQEDVVQILQKITTGIREGGLIIISFLISISFLVILVIISMKAASRRREIKIVQLIGATAAYIRGPFLVEGIFYGLVGALLSWALVYGLLWYATPTLKTYLEGIPLLPVSLGVMLVLLGGLALVGIIIGSLGAFLAVKRYLR